MVTENSGIWSAELFAANAFNSVVFNANIFGGKSLQAGTYFIKLQGSGSGSLKALDMMTATTLSFGVNSGNTGVDTNGVWYKIVLTQEAAIGLTVNETK